VGDTWITALVHFVPDDPAAALPGPAARLAAHLGAIAGAGQLARPREVVETALRCRRRPGRRRCVGRIVVRRQEAPAQIRWACPVCDDNGVITSWQGTPWDLTRSTLPTHSTLQPPGSPDPLAATGPRVAERVRSLELPDDQYDVLRTVPLPDVAAARVVLGARLARWGARLRGSPEVLDTLLEAVAAEAQATPHGARLRRRRLATLLAVLAVHLGRAAE
jgi:hypothetical protein